MQSWNASSGSSRHARRGGVDGSSAPAAICTQIVDACVAGIIFVVPLLFGGRHPLGRLAFIVLACTAGVAWFARQAFQRKASWTRTWSYAIGLASILLVAWQLAPLPTSLLEQLAPRNSSLLSLWREDSSTAAGLGTWKTLSLAPSLTRTALATLVAYVLLFVVAVERLRTPADIQRLLCAIAISAVLMAGFGLLQYFTSNGLFFWFYELPYTDTESGAKGSFSCRNHFAHFLVLGLGPLFAWTVHQRHSRRPTDRPQNYSTKLSAVALPFCLALVILAVLLSLSRGGAVALTATGAICIFFYYKRGMISGSYLYGLATLGLVVVGVLSLHGYGAVTERLDDFTTGSIEELDRREGRRKIWSANLSAIKSGGLFGAGAGSHREIYPVYLEESLLNEYTHAENGPLQIAIENGFLGIALLSLVLVTIVAWCWKSLRVNSDPSLILAVAVAASCAASVIHSLVDFVWFVPACMSLAILQAACALRLAQLSSKGSVEHQIQTSWSRPRWIGLTAVTALASFWAVSTIIGPASASIHWDKYLLTATAKRHHTARLLRLHEPSSDDDQRSQSLIDAMIFQLRQVITRDPHSARAHLRLAGKYLQLFDERQRHAANAMSIDQIRSAAEASQFASADKLREWLFQAFGENSNLLYLAYQHTRQALQLCPMQGEGYLYLANLCFLSGQGRTAIDDYIAQGLLVRPHDGQVLFEAGRQQMLLGESEQAVELWQRIFHDQGLHQMQIVRLLAGRFPAALFIQTFKPGWQTLPFVWQRYRKLGNTDDWQQIVEYAAKAAEAECSQFSAQRVAWVWRTLAFMHGELENNQTSIDCLQLAYEAAPDDYSVRREMGRALLKNEHYREAELQLRWCLARRPDDPRLRSELVQATKQHMTRTATAEQNQLIKK